MRGIWGGKVGEGFIVIRELEIGECEDQLGHQPVESFCS
jgi:hypothetical protein